MDTPATPSKRLTPSQEAAVKARGNVLVVAGAGTGKTKTLVERCLQLMIEERCSVAEMLVVTFTEAAAAELRHRLRGALEETLTATADVLLADHLSQQLALLDSALIGTLHSFSLRLVRQHFLELALDPAVSVLDESQTAPLMALTMDALMERHYAADDESSARIRRLIQHWASGREKTVRNWVWNLHRYTQTLENPDRWLSAQEQLWSSPDAACWRDGLLASLPQWAGEWLPRVRQEQVAPMVDCAAALQKLLVPVQWNEFVALITTLRDRANSQNRKDWGGEKTEIKKRLKHFYADVQFLADVLPAQGGSDPLAQDLDWGREAMLALLQLAREYAAAFAQAKRRRGGVDFSDLEQLALRLLRDPCSGAPSSVAQAWRERLRYIFVDEYQDVNPAQDAILRAVSREGAGANRFLVGDVKQSIYRFHRADPKIFQHYERQWRQAGADGSRITLSENFRSREGVLRFVNSLFAAIMQPVLGGLDYPPEVRLDFGARAARAALADPPEGPVEPRVELLCISTDTDSKDGGAEGDGDDAAKTGDDVIDLLREERSARLVARRLQRLHVERHLVWDETVKGFRPIQYRDMVVLLRAPSGRAEAYAKEFSSIGVPLEVARSGFFGMQEVADLLNLLRVLDNPMQDLPLLAVWRSPLVGFSLEDLAGIRAAKPKVPLWAAAKTLTLETDPPSRTFAAAVSEFFARFERWRALALECPVSQCLETILAETRYESLLLAEFRGAERVANVRRLLALCRGFDPWRRDSLYRFLQFVKEQEEEEVEHEPAQPPGSDAVRLMSIHKSKGLEFPVVVLAGIETRFNMRTLNEPMLFHELHGLCPKIIPPEADQSYPSLPYWLARREEKRESAGEELRLLYVALTRARDTLILVGDGDLPEPEEADAPAPGTPVPGYLLAKGNSYLDWIRLWLSHNPEADAASGQGVGACVRSCRVAPDDLLLRPAEGGLIQTADAPPRNGALVIEIEERLRWSYPFDAAAREPARKRVSELLREDLDEGESQALFGGRRFATRSPGRKRRPGQLSASEIGSAYHRFMEVVALDQLVNPAAIESEIRWCVGQHYLTEAEAAALDRKALAGFFMGDIGQRILAQAESVQREMPFTAAISAMDLAHLGVPISTEGLDQEFFVIRGKADLVVIQPGEIWLLDYKTDRIEAAGLEELVRHYSIQVNLYALALERIYSRPVTERWLHLFHRNETISVPPP